MSGNRALLVFPSLTALFFGVAVHLLMLGLLAEAALFHGNRWLSFSSPLLAALDLVGREGKGRSSS